MTWTYKPEEYL